MPLHAPTIFLGSFLLFQVQPLIGRFILPWFGGSPAVWTTCMLFFQSVLLAGYAYAHGAAFLTRRRQVWLHGGLLVAALLLLPIIPDAQLWKPGPGDPPVAAILLLLAATIGIPYLLLSASAPLVQHWFTHDRPGQSPYRLYALSNAGSLLALLSYPFLVEPYLPLRWQALLWSAGFALYAVLCLACAATRQPQPVANAPEVAPPPVVATPGLRRVSPGDLLLWLLLSACGSALLLASTNQLCQEVAVVPFLWIVPLALYLLTFILCFRDDWQYDRMRWGLLLLLTFLLAGLAMHLGPSLGLPVQILIYLVALFVGCSVCHGELVRLRPDPTHLTVFYLALAAGGALGGASVALAAPALFTGFWEYPLSLVLAALVVLAAWWRDGFFRNAPRWQAGLAATVVVGLALFLAGRSWYAPVQTLAASRNFYGVLRVLEQEGATGTWRLLSHGRVNHGLQFRDSARSNYPAGYYTAESGVALAWREMARRDQALRVGVIGLGTGTLAVYGRPGDTLRFYEINPGVIQLARDYFSYLGDSPARVETVLGDARIVLESELAAGAKQDFDLLVVDAFSSDAIPLHLLTRECFELYARRLHPNGLLVVHVTNTFLDLVPLVRTQGEAAGFHVGLVQTPADPATDRFATNFLLLTRQSKLFEGGPLRDHLAALPPSAMRPWTDDYASLWPLLKW